MCVCVQAAAFFAFCSRRAQRGKKRAGRYGRGKARDEAMSESGMRERAHAPKR